MSRLDQLRQLADAQPDDPFAQYGVGLELMQLERWDEAVTVFEQTLSLDENYIAAWLQKARAEMRLQRRDAARTTLQRGIAAAAAAGDRHAADEMRGMLEMME